jgi:Arc/MetJ-type ribon-helix-helix transcriptional regulator
VKIELSSHAEQWVQAEIAAGHFVNAGEAIDHAINKAKLTGLREELIHAAADPQRYTIDEVKNHLAAKRAELEKNAR